MSSQIYRKMKRPTVGGTQRPKKYKVYLFHCPENQRAYRLLASREWNKHDQFVLPPIRVRSERAKLYGNEYSLYLHKMPIVYGYSGYLPKGAYRIKDRGNRHWQLKQV